MATYTAGCSSVGGFGYANRFTLVVELSDSGGNSSTNTSTVNYNVYFYNSSGGGTFTSKTRLYFALNGQVIRDQTLEVTGPRNGSVGIASGSISVGHNNDGTKTIGFHALVQSVNKGISSSCAGDFELNTIPRYLDSLENNVRGTGLNNALINWSCSPDADYIRYSLNGGGWTDAHGLGGDSRGGYYDIGGLYPGTNYNVRTAIRRRDSGLWSETGYCYPTTKAISTITGWTQLTLPIPESTSTINYSVNNPSGNTTYVFLERNNDGGGDYSCNSGDASVSSGNKTLSLSKDAINKIYSLHSTVTTPYNGNKNLRGTSGMMITCRTSGNEYYYHCYNVTFIMSKDNCGPTAMADFTCQEQIEEIADLTGCSTSTTYARGNGLRLVSGYSSLLIKTPANPLTTRGGAWNASISIAGGDYINAEVAQEKLIEKVKIDSFSVTAIDTRYFDYTLPSTGITLLNYTPVTINDFKIDRGDGIETTCYLTVTGTYNPVDFGRVVNDIPIVKLLVKNKNVSWTADVIDGTENGVLNESKINAYTITDLITKSNGTFSCLNRQLKVKGRSGNLIKFAFGTDYDARIIIYDQLTMKEKYSEQICMKDTQISSGKILFSAVKGEGVCFGTFYDSEIGGPLQVNKKEVLGSEVISTWDI